MIPGSLIQHSSSRSVHFWNYLIHGPPKPFATLPGLFRFTLEWFTAQVGVITEILSKLYPLRFVSDVLDGLVHLFGFGQEFTHFSLLLDLLAVHWGQIKELIANIVDSINLSLCQGHLMTQLGQFNSLKAFQPFQDARILRPDIPLNDSLDKPYLLNPILQPFLWNHYTYTFQKPYLCNCAIILSLLSTKFDLIASDK